MSVKAGELQKSTVFCARCGSRLTISMSKGRHGGVYPYLFCLGRQRRRCDLPFLPLEQVEEFVCQVYRGVRWKGEGRTLVRDNLLAELDAEGPLVAKESQRLRNREAELERQRMVWAEKVADGVIPDDLGRSKQLDLANALIAVRNQLAQLLEVKPVIVRDAVLDAGRLIDHCDVAYRAASEKQRRAWNQVIFERLLVDAQGVTVAVVNGGLAALLELEYLADNDEATYLRESKSPDRTRDRGSSGMTPGDIDSAVETRPIVFLGRGSSQDTLVGAEGLEPPTPAL